MIGGRGEEQGRGWTQCPPCCGRHRRLGEHDLDDALPEEEPHDGVQNDGVLPHDRFDIRHHGGEYSVGHVRQTPPVKREVTRTMDPFQPPMLNMPLASS